MLDKFFKLQQRNTSIRTELIAGVTTFLTMAYIIFVNPSVLEKAGMDKEALIAVTCIVGAASTILMGLIPNVPIAMAPGMGLNAFFAYTLVLTEGISWQTALGMTFLAGCLFLILSLIGVREKILQTFPKSLISGISVGIGIFLLFIGLQNMDIIVAHPATLVTLGELTPEVLIGIGGLFLMIILIIKKIKGGVLIGIAFSTLIALILGYIRLPSEIISLNIDMSPIAFQLDIKSTLTWSLIGPIFALMYIDMFDTLGTVVACSREAGLVKKDGKIHKISHMLGVDAVATIFSGLMGTSPTTSYVESATGIAEGGKTGLTSVVTGLLFLTGLIFIPIIGMVPVYATAPALIIVGILMIRQVNGIDFSNFEESIPAILTMMIMALSFQISTGLAFGFISWGLIKILLFKFQEINWVMYLVIALSLISLVI